MFVGSGVELRIFLIACALLVALITGLLFAAPALVDVTRYRGDIEAVATRAAGQPVQINGALAFRILPTPRFIAENLIVAPPSRHSDLHPLLKARRAEILLSLSDLLSGTTSADRVVILDPEIVLHTNLAGHDNLSADGDTGLPARNISIEGGILRYLDEERGREFLVSGLAGQLLTDGAFDTRNLNLSGIWRQREARLTARVTSSERPAISGSIAVAGLGEATIQGRLDIAEGWRIDGQMGLELDDLSESFPAVVAGVDTPDKLALVASGQAVISPGNLAIEGISGEIGQRVFGGRLHYSDSEFPELEASLSFEQLDGAALVPWVQAVAERAVAGEIGSTETTAIRARFQFDAGLISLPRGFVRQLSSTASYENGILKIDRLAALLPGGSDIAFSGDVRLSGGAFRLAGKAEFGSDNLTALLEAAEAPVRPGGHGRLRNLGLSADLLIDSSVAQVSDIDLRFDQSRMTGGIAIALVSRPSFSLNLTVDQLNANAYAGLFDLDAAGLTLLKGDPARPEMPLLAAFDTNASVRIGRLIAGGSVARGIDLEAGLIGGVLDIKSFVIEDIDGSSLNLSGRIDTPANPQWLLKGEIASDTPARLLGGASGEAFPLLSRTGSLLARFGLEGGPARTAAEIELSTTSLDVQLTGLISSIFADAEFDLDANLSAPRSRIALMHMFPAWRLPSGIAGPLLAEGTVKGRPVRFAVNGKVDALSARAEVDGSVAGLGTDDPQYGLDVRVRHGDFLQLMETMNAGLETEAAEPAPLDLAFRAEGNGSRTRFTDIVAQAGSDRAVAELDMDWSGPRPVAELSVSGGNMQLDRYFADGTYGALAAVSADDRAFRWSRLPLDWPWTRSLGLTASLEFSNLTALGVPMTDARFGFRAGPDGWTIDGLAARLGDGAVQATMVLVTRPVPELNISARFETVALPLLLDSFLGRKHEVDGNLSADFTASARGLTEYDLVRSMTGRVELQEGTSVIWPPEVHLPDLRGAIAISKGVAKAAPALRAGSNGEDGTIVGSIDIGGWLADLEVRSGRDAAARRISVSGPLHDVSVR